MMATEKIQQIIGPRTPAEELTAHRMRYLWTPICMWGATFLMVVSVFFPYWSLVLHAPQYPRGLMVNAYLSRLEGDVNEIDGLNHYIGMRPLNDAALLEKSISVFGLIALALVVAAAIYIHSPWAAVFSLPAILFPVVFLADLFLWLNYFGQNLDPHAALSNSVKPFTPTVLGTGVIGQFSTDAYADIGLLMATAASILIIVGLYLQRRAYKPLVEKK